MTPPSRNRFWTLANRRHMGKWPPHWANRRHTGKLPPAKGHGDFAYVGRRRQPNCAKFGGASLLAPTNLAQRRTPRRPAAVRKNHSQETMLRASSYSGIPVSSPGLLAIARKLHLKSGETYKSSKKIYFNFGTFSPPRCLEAEIYNQLDIDTEL